MAYRVLIIDDVASTRNILQTELNKRLREPVVAATVWSKDWPATNKIVYEIKHVEDEVFSQIINARKDGNFHEFLSKLFSGINIPHLLILDLAMTDDETVLLETAGGTDNSGKMHADEIALKNVTGYQILKWAAQSPTNCEDGTNFRPQVIITSYASNPRVIQACLNAGAYSVATKPCSDTEMPFLWDIAHGFKSNILKLDEANIEAAKEWEPRIDSYLTGIARAVLNALKEAALRSCYGHTPAPIPFWAVHDEFKLGPGLIRDTNLLLMDIRGSSKLVTMGRGKPEAVFDLMNCIWGSVLKVLRNHNAVVNNFIGDAALVFFGVYNSSSGTAQINETVSCARALCEAFNLNGNIRNDLQVAISNIFDAHKYKDTREQMLNLVNSLEFGLRVVVTVPDHEEALYGRVGTAERWQHTILSSFMNALARAENAVGRWEKEGSLRDEVGGHCFLLWDTNKTLPNISNATLDTPEIYLGRQREEIKDIPHDMNILRVNWHSEINSTKSPKEIQQSLQLS